MPHKLKQGKAVSNLVQFLIAEFLVVLVWLGVKSLGIKPIGRPPVAWLVWSLVFVAGLTYFGVRQDRKGERGVGVAGALVTAVAATSASLVASALSGGH